jgi:hypothetical protein
MNGKSTEFDSFHVQIAQDAASISGHHSISGLLEAMQMYTFRHQVDQGTNKDQAKGTNNVYVVIYLVCIAPIIYMVEKSSIWKASKDLFNKRIVHQTHCAVVVHLVQTQY